MRCCRARDVGEGERLDVWAAVDRAESGVIMPETAVVISEGKYWCYVEKQPGVFARTAINASRPIPGGYFVKEGIASRRISRDGVCRPAAGPRDQPARKPNDMMRWLVSVCVRHYGVVTVLSALALVLGCWGALRSSVDVFPEFVPSQVDIQTEAPGFAPQQVEELVTRPIENLVNGAAGLATLRSESIPGLSVITITFADGVDLYTRDRESPNGCPSWAAACLRGSAHRNSRRWYRARWIC